MGWLVDSALMTVEGSRPDRKTTLPTSWASTVGSRRSMQANRGRDSRPELAVRSILHRRGLRYRVSCRPIAQLNRTADLVFRGPRVAVFIDGCFWHGCPVHGTRPARNGSWWGAKLDRNVERDRETDGLLRDAGWTVLRYWEHEDPTLVALAIEGAVRSPTSRPGSRSIPDPEGETAYDQRDVSSDPRPPPEHPSDGSGLDHGDGRDY